MKERLSDAWIKKQNWLEALQITDLYQRDPAMSKCSRNPNS